MELIYLSKDAIADFKVNFDMYKKHYNDQTSEWFIRHWEQNHALYKSNLVVPDILFSYQDDYTHSDKSNVIAVHSSLRTVPKSVVADERFWSAFCHTYGWEFMKYRRADDIENGDAQRLKSLFFFSAGIKRSCYLNGLAKYWWCGEMVYDPNSPDHYAALDVLCGLPNFSSLILYLSSSNFTANKNIILGIIDSFRHLKEQNIELKVVYWKEVLAYLNQRGSVIILDMLSRADITELCDHQLQKIVKAPIHATV